MLRSMYTSITGLKNHQAMLDVTANNIANVNTYGFKGSTVSFQDQLSQTLQGASAPTSNLGGTNAQQVGLGSRIGSITQNHGSGSIATTGRPTDLAIDGDGYFRVTNDPNGLAGGTQETYYMRNGEFKLDQAGDLVTSDGYYVIGRGVDPAGPPAPAPQIPLASPETTLRIDPSTITDWSIGADGKVVGTDITTGNRTTIGWVTLAKFANPSGLVAEGGNKWRDSPNSGAEIADVAGTNGLGSLASGALEMSNVDLATEFTDMIRAQRGFQANSRVITTSDEILQELVNLKR